MSLGVALVHPIRINEALYAGKQRQGFDKLIHSFCGVLGIEGLETEIEALLQSNGEAVESFITNLTDLFEPGRPLAHLTTAFAIDLEDPNSLGEAFDRICAFLETAEAAQISALVVPVLDVVLEALPNLDTEVAASFATSRLDELVGLLKTPLRRGRKDVAAIKAYRAAMTLKCLLEPAYQKIQAFGRIDLKLLLRESILALLANVEGVSLQPLRDLVLTLKAEFGPLLRAIISCAASGSAEGGVQFMPTDPLTFANEVQAVPHTSETGQAIFGIDIATNILILFNLIWEVVRVRPFHQRGFDGFLMILGVLWHAGRTLARAVAPNDVNRSVDDAETNAGDHVLNWLMSDIGDFSVHTFLRIWMTVYEWGDGKTNWALMFLPRFLTYVVNTFNLRVFYHFARSVWYFAQHKDVEAALATLTGKTNTIINVLRPLFSNDDTSALGRGQIPMGRLLMIIVPIIWWLNMFVGWGLPWESFVAEEFPNDGRIMGAIFGMAGAGYAVANVVIGIIMNTASIFYGAIPNLPMLLAIIVAVAVFMLSLIFTTAGLESDESSAASAASLWIPIVLLFLIVVVGILGWVLPVWASGSITGGARLFVNGLSTTLMTLLICLGTGLFSSVTWWFMRDDSRDKLKVFDRLDFDGSPYILPYRDGENWFCGQSFHGIFSHTISSDTSHYAYDFNEAQGSVTLNSRSGITVAVTQDNPNDLDVQNAAMVMHTDWTSAADPGTDDERVITYGNYVHAEQFGVRSRHGQYVPQGVHFIDIDSTGTSAVHHLHIAAQTAQRNYLENDGDPSRNEEGYPFIFKDDSTDTIRVHPIQHIGKGAGEIKGRPISFAFYLSHSTQTDPHPIGTTVEMSSTSTDDVPDHTHRVMIDMSMITGADIPENLELRTTVDAGHFHAITLTRAQLIRLFRLQGVEGAETSSVLDHTHTLVASHELGGGWIWGADTGHMTVGITEVPSGQLIAQNPAPYFVLGERMIVRVNDQSTEWFLYAGERSRNVADMVIDAGLQGGTQLQVGPTPNTNIMLPGSDQDLWSMRDVATEVSLQFRIDTGPTGNAPDRTVVGRAEPVLVLETQARGTDASIEITGGTAPMQVLGDEDLITPSVGRGAFGDLGAVPREDLATHVDDILQNGWPAPPVGLSASIIDNRLQLDVGGAAVDLSESGARIAQIATALYDDAATPPEFRAIGPMPLTTGTFSLAPGHVIPLLATHPHVQFAAPAEGTVLPFGVGASTANVTTASADAATLARQIMHEVEGVRAWSVGADVVVQALAAGPDATLTIADPISVTEAGTKVFETALDYTDPSVILPDHLRQLINDAGGRTASAASNARASLDGDRLRIEVDDPATISLLSFQTTGPVPFALTQDAPNVLLSDPLPGIVRFDGPAWIDLDLDNGPQNVRVPLYGDSARLDTVFDRLPNDGETLELSINGSPLVVTFGNDVRSMADVAEAVGAAANGLLVRIAYRLSVEDMLWGDDGANDIDLLESNPLTDGLAGGGFLRERPVLATARLGRGLDMMAQGSTFPAPERAEGRVLSIATSARDENTDQLQLSCTEPVARIDLTVTPDADPLQFTSGANPIVTPGGSTSFEMQTYGVQYQFDALDANNDLVATTYMYLSAQPAVARAVDAAQLPLPGDTTLTMTVLQDSTVFVTTAVDLAGAGTVDEIAIRINMAAPHLRAWVARVPAAIAVRDTRPGDFDERLHIETVEGGTTWSLRLSSLQIAAALGFSLTSASADAVTFDGTGNVGNWRAVTIEEVEQALGEAAASMTGSDNIEGTPEQFRISMFDNNGQLELSSAEGRIDVIAEPPALAEQLSVEVTDDVTRIGPVPPMPGMPTPIAVDSGRILLRVAERGLAAIEIFGAPAELRSNLPITTDADEIDDMLEAMQADPMNPTANRIRLVINGTAQLLPPLPPSITTIEDAVEFLSLAISGVTGGAWWIGLVSDPPGTPAHCIIQTIQRGSVAALVLDLTRFSTIPDAGILGFTDPGIVMTTGEGNVENLGAVDLTVAAGGSGTPIEELIAEAIDRGGARQSVYAVESSPSNVTLRSVLQTQTLTQLSIPAPGAVDFLPPGTLPPPTAGAVVEAAIAGSRIMGPGIMEIETTDPAIGGTRTVRSLFHAEPARLLGFDAPTDFGVVNTRVLSLIVGLATFEITFDTTAGSTPDQRLKLVTRQIERGTNWSVRVVTHPGTNSFDIETVDRGTRAAIGLGTIGAGQNAVTGDTATGFGTPENTTAQGTGSVPAMRAVQAADYAAVLQEGMISERGNLAQSVRDQGLNLGGSTYDPPEPDLTEAPPAIRPLPKEFARLLSTATGAGSSVVPLEILEDGPALIEAFDMERSLELGPAMRAAIRIPPFTETNLSGRLYLQFNENAGRTGLPPEQNVIIDVPNDNYDPAGLARLIHARLFAGGIGSAQAYQDGSILIETAANGLAGTVRLPGAAMPDDAGERALIDQLLPGGAFARGWPNAGRPNPANPDERLPGYRARPGNAQEEVSWTFADASGATATVTAANGATPETVAEAADAALSAAVDAAGTPVGRIGMASVGHDGALYIEGWGDAFALTPALGVDEPSSIGETPERREEPAMGLRGTHEPRTLRFLRDRNGLGVLDDHNDFGWVRLPTDGLSDGEPLEIRNMPPGRMLALGRTDAAKAHNYDAAGEMVALSIPADGDQTPVITAARYWITLEQAVLMGIRQDDEGTPMLLVQRGVYE